MVYTAEKYVLPPSGHGQTVLQVRAMTYLSQNKALPWRPYAMYLVGTYRTAVDNGKGVLLH